MKKKTGHKKSPSRSDEEKTVASLPAGLYLVPTPIGHLRDITLRALDILQQVHTVICEDTRITGNLLKHYGLKKSLLVYHDYTTDHVREKIIQLLQKQALALVCDAGTPLISDPGYQLVRTCIQENIYVTALPGANAILPALTLSGLPTDKFLFLGFLPKKTEDRKNTLLRLQEQEATLVIYESAKRVHHLLQEIHLYLGHRNITLVREMTKVFEQIYRGTTKTLPQILLSSGIIKGECVILIAGVEKRKPSLSPQAIDEALSQAFQNHNSTHDAVKLVTQTYGIPKTEVYKRALSYKRKGEKAEWIAQWLLRLKGYHILKTHFRTKGGEIDIVARRKDVIAIVEVKTRPNMLTASQAISPQQQKRLVRTTQVFLQNYPQFLNLSIRFDAILVVPWQLPLHIRNAFEPKESYT